MWKAYNSKGNNIPHTALKGQDMRPEWASERFKALESGEKQRKWRFFLRERNNPICKDSCIYYGVREQTNPERVVSRSKCQMQNFKTLEFWKNVRLVSRIQLSHRGQIFNFVPQAESSRKKIKLSFVLLPHLAEIFTIIISTTIFSVKKDILQPYMCFTILSMVETKYLTFHEKYEHWYLKKI